MLKKLSYLLSIFLILPSIVFSQAIYNDDSWTHKSGKVVLTKSTDNICSDTSQCAGTEKLQIIGKGKFTDTLVSLNISSGATLSGSNTGDETATTIKSKLGITTLSGSNTGDQDLSSYLTSSTASSTYVPQTTTVNGHALSANVTVTNADLGAVPTTTTVNGHALSSNVTVTASDVSLGNLTNDKQIKGLSIGTTNGHLVTWGSDGYTASDGGAVPTECSTSSCLLNSSTTGNSQTYGDNSTKLATTSFVQSAIAGLNQKADAQEATTSALSANTYNNGASGVGATLTANSNAALTVDSIAVSSGDRILVKNESTGANNGIYVVTQTGSSILPYILTRATDSNTSVELIGAIVAIQKGTVNADLAFINTNTSAITIGSTSITYSQFGGGGGTITLSGDISGNGTSSIATTLATVNSNVGSFTNANITVNGKGLITAASNGSGGGGGISWIIKTNSNTPFTATAGQYILCDTSGGVLTITLPASPSSGDTVTVKTGGYASTNAVTIGRNGSTIFGLSEDQTSNTPNIELTYIYDGTTWRF